MAKTCGELNCLDKWIVTHCPKCASDGGGNHSIPGECCYSLEIERLVKFADSMREEKDAAYARGYKESCDHLIERTNEIIRLKSLARQLSDERAMLRAELQTKEVAMQELETRRQIMGKLILPGAIDKLAKALGSPEAEECRFWADRAEMAIDGLKRVKNSAGGAFEITSGEGHHNAINIATEVLNKLDEK